MASSSESESSICFRSVCSILSTKFTKVFKIKFEAFIMSIQVENNLKNSDKKDIFEQRAHYIPCKVEEDGEANVNKYFEPYVDNDNGDLTATFRGHSLDGVKMKLPGGYKAVVVTEAKRPLAEDAVRKFQVAGGFKDIVYWNWDKKPSKNDNLVRALDWTDIVNAIHGD